VRWPRYDVAIFDCDSTLSSIEGIDELAVLLDKKAEIAELTDAAMNGQIDLSEVYGKRLELLNPTQHQVVALRQAYKAGTMPFVKKLIKCLSNDGVENWIVSGGLYDAVKEYGIWLGVDSDNIRAVGSEYDPLTKKWWSGGTSKAEFMEYESGELTSTVGKGDVIKSSVHSNHKKIMFGDGVSDLAAQDEVDLFVAYAGVVDRPAVTENAGVVIESESLASAACLIIGPYRVVEMLNGKHKDLASASLDDVKNGSLFFNNKDLETKFQLAFNNATKGM